MAKKYVAIDLGTFHIKMANVYVKWNKVELDRPVTIKSPGFPVQNSRLIDSRELAGLIRENLPEDHPRKAIVILNEAFTAVKSLRIPNAPSRETRKMVIMDAGQYLPNNADNYTIRYRILDSEKNGSHLLVASVDKNFSSHLHRAFKMAGLSIEAFDVGMNCMVKYLRHLYRSNAGMQKVTALADIGAASLKLVVMEKRNVLYFQVLNHNSRKIDMMIANELDIEYDNAEKLKIETGIGPENERTGLDDRGNAGMLQAAGAIVKRQVDLMLNDIYKQLQAIASSHGLRTGKILITGGMSRMKGLCRYISEAFDIPCETVSFDDVFTFTLSEKLTFKDMNYHFPVCTGMAGSVLRR